MLTLILADAELELIPKSLWTDPGILKYARAKKKKPGNLLLDASYHHAAIKKIDPAHVNRRGRPDIVHMFLLIGLESILNKQKQLQLYVHTRENLVIYVKPEVHIPKNYARFLGLIESLYLNRVVPDKHKPLLTLKPRSLKDLVEQLSVKTVLLHPKGTYTNLHQYPMEENMALIIGGFAEGDFQSDVSFINERISISSYELMAWVVEYEVITAYEQRFMI